MNALKPLPHPVDAHSLPRTGDNSSSSRVSTSSRAPFFFPNLGDEIEFTRATGMPPERGIVRGREFCTLRREIIDMNANPLTLVPGQYHQVQP